MLITSLRAKNGVVSDITSVRMSNVLHVRQRSGTHWIPLEEKEAEFWSRAVETEIKSLGKA